MATKVKNIFKSISTFLMDNFHQSQNLEYRLLKRAHLLYQHEVVKQRKSFNIYINDSLAEIQNFTYKTDKELQEKTRIHSKVSSLFIGRPDLIQKHFNKKDFYFQDYKDLVKEYNTTSIVKDNATQSSPIEKPILDSSSIEEKLSKVRNEILKYESGEKLPKHIGQRMFGYLLKANYINAYNDSQRLEKWAEFTGVDTKPEMSYLRDPDYNKNETIKINQQLKQIEEFFYLVGLEIPITYYEKKKK